MTETAGQVEREARQLVAAAARWLSVVPDDAEYAARTADPEPPAGSSAGSGEGGSGAAAPSEEGPGEDAADHGASGEDAAADAEHLCRGCPWCRARAAAGPIGADTLDSLAHLLSAAAESLSLFAQSRREAAGETTQSPERSATADDATPDSATPEDAMSDHATPEDAVIDWDDEDEDELLSDEDDEGKRPPSRERKTR
ncbi:hypothetical protein [Ornithinimicrobium murale]|uniref:hypothetical protein n=1 Tax=Ornithinimicrobium murale TaxID=1050153 RepID=UPI000E0D20D7|nr:hypothetical protein [Ornithinimicrobium murale]